MPVGLALMAESPITIELNASAALNESESNGGSRLLKQLAVLQLMRAIQLFLLCWLSAQGCQAYARPSPLCTFSVAADQVKR